MAEDDQSGRGSEGEPPFGQADRPANGGSAFDDVDSRAADLLARLAARSRQREESEPDPVPAAEEVGSVFAPPADEAVRGPVEPPSVEDPHPGPRQAEQEWPPSMGAPAERPPEPLDDPWPVQPDPEPPYDPAPAEQPLEPPPPFPDEPSVDPRADPSASYEPRSPRRMAAPPWQQTRSTADYDDPGYEQTPEPASPRSPGPVPPGRSGPPPPPPTPPRWPGPPPWGSSPPPTGEGPQGRVDEPPAAEPPRSWSQPRGGSSPGGIGAAGWADFGEDYGDDRRTPQFGWRRVLHQATGGRLNPGLSQRDRDQQDLMDRIRQPIAGDFRIAVLSIKGGVGKTTTTIGLGSALAMVRADRVVAVDANPDRGTLAERVADTSTASTVRDLLRDQNIARYADVRNHTRMAPSRLEVLASEQDPAVAEVFGESDYRRTIEILRNFYNIILTDCGTGIMHASMASVLDMAHSIVLVSSPAVDAARSAAATLDWLAQHGHGMLARESHVVLSGVQPGATTPQFERVYEYFEERSGSIHVIPFEPHLAKGADIDFELLAPATVQAYLELAGAVSEKFARVR